MQFQKTINQYDYQFPQELIAQTPAHPRDSARLLIYNRATNAVSYDSFRNIAKYLPKNAVLVLNQTKVLPARLTVTKETGGQVKILYVQTKGKLIGVMANKPLIVGSRLTLTKKLQFMVRRKEGKLYFLAPTFPIQKIEDVLWRYGSAPLPPYIKHPTLAGKKLRDEYQSVFARRSGSIAAPTASLHFTKALLAKIRRAGIAVKFVTLHVNLGTFAPLAAEQWEKGKLHSEQYMIDAKTAEFLNKSKRENRPIIAVGTTVTRTLESAAVSAIQAVRRHSRAGGNLALLDNDWIPAFAGMTNSGRLKKLRGATNLFIKDTAQLKFVSGLITNFHVPRSSLLMLVSAFTGRKELLDLYQSAIQKKFRLFSFGDGMLIL